MGFVITVLTIVGLLNLYAYRSLAPAVPGFEWTLAVAIGLLYCSLPVAIFLERKGNARISLPFSWAGFTWLGLVGVVATGALAVDIAALVFKQLDPRRAAYIVWGYLALVVVVGSISARRPRLRKVRLRSAKVDPRGSRERPLRVLQISDLHLGDGATLGWLRSIVLRVNALKPDVVVSTGDLFDGYLSLMDPFVDLLKTIDAPLGKFAISGNHEVYAGLEESMQLTREAGFETLRNQAALIEDDLAIAGVEDPATLNGPRERETLAPIPASRFTLLLKHRPDVDPASVGRFDLQLSGHTHGGQIFPFLLFTKIQYRAKVGLSRIAQNQWLYLSRGTGSWGPQIRFLAPPELTLFELAAE